MRPKLTIANNHWFNGDQASGVRVWAWLILTKPNCATTVTAITGQ
jgi:hypothetical protein